MGRSAWVRLFALVLGVVVGVGAGCNFFNDYGNDWANAEATSAGAGGNMCAGFGGYGGEGGAGGDDEGAGGDGSGGSGVGGSPGVSVGAGGSSSGDAVGSSVGAGAGDARSGWGEGHVARAPRHHRGRRGGIGRAQQAGCSIGWTFPPGPSPIPLPSGAVTLSTTRLRFICTAQNVGNGATGIQFNSACGLQFEAWVLWTLQQKPNTKPIFSMERETANTKNGNGGKPASVIPDYVRGASVILPRTGVTLTFSDSMFGEVKAVTGNLTLGYSQYQILGLLDVARLSPPTSVLLETPPPPQVVFTTTGNTAIPGTTLFQASFWKVAVWQQFVYEVPAVPNDPNPELCLGPYNPLNTAVYPLGTTFYTARPAVACSTLTSVPEGWVALIPTGPDDPDPPTVD